MPEQDAVTPPEPPPAYNPAEIVPSTPEAMAEWKRRTLAEDTARRAAAKQAAEPPAEPEAPRLPVNRWLDPPPTPKLDSFDLAKYVSTIEKSVFPSSIFTETALQDAPAELAELSRLALLRRRVKSDNADDIEQFVIAHGRRPKPGEIQLLPEPGHDLDERIAEVKMLMGGDSAEITKRPDFADLVGKYGKLAARHLDAVRAAEQAKVRATEAKSAEALVAKLDAGGVPSYEELFTAFGGNRDASRARALIAAAEQVWPGVQARSEAKSALLAALRNNTMPRGWTGMD